MTELEDPQLFTLEPLPSRSYEKDLDTWFDLTIEMNMDQNLIQRMGYTVLDLLSDIGGILEIMTILITYFLAFWNYNYFENFMVSRLFKLHREDFSSDEKGFESYFDRSTFIQPRRCYNPKEWLRNTLPRFLICKCLRPDRLERGFEKARS